MLSEKNKFKNWKTIPLSVSMSISKASKRFAVIFHFAITLVIKFEFKERETLANNHEDMKYMLDEEKKRLKEQLDELRFDIDAKQYQIEQLTEEMNK